MESTILGTVLMTTPPAATPPHTVTYSLFSHAAKALEPHGSVCAGLRIEKLYELYAGIQCSSGGTMRPSQYTSSFSGLE